MTTISRRLLLAGVAALGMSTSALSAATLTAGAYPANPPWEYKTASGSFEGFEVDVVKDVAKRLGDTVDFQDTGFQALFAGTSSGRIDLAISSITITNDRLKNQGFTQPYYDSDGAVLTKADAAIDTIDGLKGATVGVIAASSGEAYMKANAQKLGIADVKSYTSQDNLMLDVKAGRILGGIGEVAGFQYAMSKTPGYKIAVRIPTGERFAIMTKKGSPLLQPMNDAISAMKADGTMAAIHQKWFGTAPLPGSSTVTALPLPTAAN
jgi:polar amino acid transport system substrate-binding protein